MSTDDRIIEVWTELPERLHLGKECLVRDACTTLGARLRYVRNYRRLSQHKLAEVSGVSKTTIISLERDETKPQAKTIDRLAECLRVARHLLTNTYDPNARRPRIRLGIPFASRLASLVGRAQHIEEVTKGLKAAKPLVVLHGIPAGGKTRLAIEAAHELISRQEAAKADVSQVVWVNAANGLQSGFAEIVSYDGDLSIKRHERILVEDAFDLLRAMPDVLIVLDDLPRLDDALKPIGPTSCNLASLKNARLLVTTNDDVGPEKQAKWQRQSEQTFIPIEIKGLSAPDGLSLLCVLTKRAQDGLSAEEARAGAKLSTIVDGLPLALEIIADNVAQHSIESFASCAEHMKAQPLKAIDATEPSVIHPTGILQTFESMWRRLQGGASETYSEAQMALLVASLADMGSQIPLARVCLMAGIPMWAGDRRHDRCESVLRLVGSVFTVGDGEGVRLHRLVHDFATRRMAAITDFKIHRAIELIQAYQDIDGLANHCRRRRVAEVQADLDMASSLLGNAANDEKYAKWERFRDTLVSLLQIDGSVLDGSIQKDRSELVAQQLLLRVSETEALNRTVHSVELEHPDRTTQLNIRQTASNYLETNKRPYLEAIWSIPWTPEFVSCDQTIRTSSGLNAIAIASDSAKRIAVLGSAGGEIGVLDLQHHALELLSPAHKRQVWSVDLTPDGKLAGSASDDCIVCYWDLVRRILVASHGEHLEHGEKWVNALSISPSGQMIASGDDAGRLGIWHPNDRRSGFRFANSVHDGWVLAVKITSDSKRIFSGSQDGCIKVTEVATGRLLFEEPHAHDGWVRNLALTDDEHHLISVSTDRTIAVWLVADDGLRLVNRLRGHTGWIRGLSVNSKNGLIISAGDDWSLRLWSLKRAISGKETAGIPLNGHSHVVRSVAQISNGRQFVSVSRDRTARIWTLDLANMRAAAKKGDAAARVTAIATSDTNTLMVCHATGAATIYDRDGSVRARTKLESPAIACALSEHEALLVLERGRILRWQWKSDLQPKIDKEARRSADALVLSIVHATRTRTRFLFRRKEETYIGYEMNSARRIGNGTMVGAVNSAGTVALADRDGNITIARSGEPEKQIRAGAPCTAIALAANDTIVAAAQGPVLRVHSVADDREIATCFLRANISALGFADANSALIAGDDTGNIHAVRLVGATF